MEEIFVASSLDGSIEPSLFYRAQGNEPRPLLVGLHTWSADRTNQVKTLLPWAKEKNWHLLLPEFRGPNLASNPRAREACASDLAKQDVMDAVAYVSAHAPVDENARLLVGSSGGGHMALMMAGYAPSFWRAVASFVPVMDVALWYTQSPALHGTTHYTDGMAACMGGPPDEATRAEYDRRSPVGWIDEIAKANVTIFTGKYDKSIPFMQTLDFYNRLTAAYPASRCFLHLFDGSHEQRIPYAEAWFDEQLSNGSEYVLTTG